MRWFPVTDSRTTMVFGMSRFRTIGFCWVLLASLAWLSGCRVDARGCRTDGDCRGRRICLEGVCQAPRNSSDADVSSDTPDVSQDADDTTDVVADVRERPDATPPPPDGSPPRDVDPAPPETGMDGGPGPDGSPITPPDEALLRVAPSDSIPFGGIAIDDEVTQSIYVYNDGTEPLRVTRVALAQTPSSGFEVDADDVPQTIQPGGSVPYSVTFDPTRRARYQNNVIVETDAPNQSQPIQIELRGFAAERQDRPCLYTTPDRVDFGISSPGGRPRKGFRVVNCSRNTDVTVTGFEWEDNPSDLFQVIEPPGDLTLAPGESRTVFVQFLPQTYRTVDAQLRIESTERSREPEIVRFRGSGGGCAEAEALGRVPGARFDRWRDGPIPVPPGEGMELIGRESTSPSGRLEYRWELGGQPSGELETINAPRSRRATLLPSTSGRYEVELNVRDPFYPDRPACASDTVEVIRLRSQPIFEASLDWDGNHDLDLEVVRSDANGNFSGGSPETLWPSEQSRNWGSRQRRTDDAFHLGDGDGSSGSNATNERILLAGIERSRDYRIVVHFEDRNGVRPLRFEGTVEIRWPDLQRMPRQVSHEFTLQELDSDWIAFELDGETKRIREIDREE